MAEAEERRMARARRTKVRACINTVETKRVWVVESVVF
jgi:hypothetical protein